MPAKNGRITHRERRFVDSYVSTGDATYAAAKAGYAVPASGGSQNLRKPIIQQEIQQRQMARLHNELVPLAYDHAATVLSDPKRPDREKTMVMKVVLDHARKVTGEGGLGDKDPAEMTPEELDRMRNYVLGEIAARAKPVIEHSSEGIFD
jgi:phage terminase small subunit